MLNLNEGFGEKAASHPAAGDVTAHTPGHRFKHTQALKTRAGVSSPASASVSLGSTFPTAASVPGGSLQGTAPPAPAAPRSWV